MTTPPAAATITTLTHPDSADHGTGNGIDVAAVGGLLAVAFDEPVTRWLVPDPHRHRQVLTGLFILMAADALTDGGWVDVLTHSDGSPVAAAIWFNHVSGEDEPAPTDEPDPRLDEVFGPDTARWRTLDELMTGHHLAGPHHYLFAIGVLPGSQGNGLGGTLLAHGHRRLGGMPSYLEATSPDSRRLYHRHGYTDLGRIDLPDGPSLRRMVHIPAPVEAAD